jgi:3-isopropylmalate/(R)-2-methylmalate dehydratase small subunit
MQPLTHVTGVAVPMIEDDVNTDQIAPLQLAKGLKPDYGELLFKRQRQNADGTPVVDHVLNQPQFASPSMLVAGHNFGCGSSRESAVWCLAAIGLRCIVARSIADIFRENCLQNGVLPIELDGTAMDDLQASVLQVDGGAPFSVDLVAQTITTPDYRTHAFEISASDKLRLIEGLDEIGLTMKHEDEIRAWEAQAAAGMPWLQQARDMRSGA